MELAERMKPEGERVKKLSHMIREYLQKNPDAGDTLAGITHWWLAGKQMDHSEDEVARALEILLQQGVIRVYKTQSDTTIYRLKK